MKLKNIFKVLLLAILALQVVSCDNKESVESPFNATPTERLNAQKEVLNNLLESSEFGWKAIYYTDTTQLGGFTHVFKFKDGKVDMASDFDDDTSVYSSEYSIAIGSTVSLLFTTKNRIHLLSDSDNYPISSLRGKGYLGDFQFLYYGQDNGDIVFKTNRSFKELRFVKAKASDWTDLAKARLMIPNVSGASTRPLFRLLETNDGAKVSQYDFTYTEATRYATSNSIEAGSSKTSNVGIAYTATGIKVSPPVKVGTKTLTDFTYDATTGNFNAAADGVTASIKYSNKPLVLTDDYKALLTGQPYTRFSYYDDDVTADAPTNSALFKAEIDKINAGLPSGQSISGVELYLNHSLGNFIYYTFNGRGAIFHYITVKEDAANKTLILGHDRWSGGFTTSPSYLAGFDKQLLDTKGIYVKKENFRIVYSNTVYTFTSASSSFRMTTWKR
ncbi:hypothetical protein FFWV33_09600 [Flavobacterium faecale]|uniref:DUF4302 domain-containing protein n=1 Tax=Flavobacterium faecale TaxID=1355330 RepID=A0A2S1LDF4_9FLAO|nr:DUF4302 domain-containing protein [Flavobacterium faecale]AWG21779.1 hypothetical protein FFWV33_09600 [Flavobacterium faecale]